MIVSPKATVIRPEAFFHVPGWIPQDVATKLCDALVDETFEKCPGQLRYGKGKPYFSPLHRLGRFGEKWISYTYKEKRKPVNPLTPTLRAIMSSVSSFVGEKFDAVCVNYYLTGEADLYPHNDIKYIPELGHEPVIASVSFGATRMFDLSPQSKKDASREKFSMPLAHGDLFVMHGESQSHWKHGMHQEPEVTEARVSLTFRRHGAE